MKSDGVSEMRIHFGPGYRVYYAREGRTVYPLLAVAINPAKTKRSKKPLPLISLLL